MLNTIMLFKFLKLSLSLLIFSSLFLLLGLEKTVLSQNPKPTPRNRNLPTPPQTPPPANNKTKPGGGLSLEPESCYDQNRSVIALIPVENPVKTVLEYPTVLVYLPDNNQNIESLEFWVNSNQGKTKMSLSVPTNSGIIQIKSPVSIELGQYIPWYFKVTCKNQNTIILNGWFQRVSLTSDIQRKIEAITPEIWYDVLANTAAELSKNPDDLDLKKHWVYLLEFINAEALKEERIINDKQ